MVGLITHWVSRECETGEEADERESPRSNDRESRAREVGIKRPSPLRVRFGNKSLHPTQSDRMRLYLRLRGVVPP